MKRKVGASQFELTINLYLYVFNLPFVYWFVVVIVVCIMRERAPNISPRRYRFIIISRVWS